MALNWILLLLTSLAGPAWAGSGPQVIQNGTFGRFPVVKAYTSAGTSYTIAAGTDLGAWYSGVTYYSSDEQPGAGQVSVQRGTRSYTGTAQESFSGDNSVTPVAPATATYLLYRGNGAAADLWYQHVSVLPGTTYTFSFYASNANPVGTTGGTTGLPVLSLLVNNTTQGATYTLANEASTDTWTRYTYTVTTGASQTDLELRLRDTSTGSATQNQVALTGLVLRANSASSGTAFSCDGAFYQIRQVNVSSTDASQGNSTKMFTVNTSSSPYTTTLVRDLTATVNALSYDPSNGYLYCLTYTGNYTSSTSGQNPQTARQFDATAWVEINRIGQGGIESLGAVSGLPVMQWAAGTVDRSNNLYLKDQAQGSVIYKLNLMASPITATTITTSSAFTAYDLAFNPVDNLVYGVYFPGILYKFDPSSSTPTLNTIDSGSYTTSQPLGSAFFNFNGDLFAYGNGNATPATSTSGKFYRLNTNTAAIISQNDIPGATNSDGASCINVSTTIDVVKQLMSVNQVSPTSYDVTYAVRLTNTGTVTATNVQVSDLLTGNANNTTFPNASSVVPQGSIAVNNLDGSALAANPAFTGVSGNAGLLTGTQPLTAGQRVGITFTVRVTYASGTVPSATRNNTAYATSASQTSPGYTQDASGNLISPTGLQAMDASTNSTDATYYPPSRTSAAADTPSPTPLTFTPGLFGTVFEDVNYGGGAGRILAASSGVARPNARVELYSGSGTSATFVSATTTDASGAYAFTGLAVGGSYVVRVVNNGTQAVSSSRTGATSSLLPVQTYAYNADATLAASRVGGQDPQRVDAANATSVGTTLASLSTTGSATSPGTIAQSLSAVTLPSTSASSTTSVDFGFNFDVVTNTNDKGQGSLRQFILNSNALGGESTLAQSGANTAGSLAAGQETSIFMIPDGATHPGLLASANGGPASQLGSGVAAIAPASALPAVTGVSTTIDGTTQTQNIGNTNNVTLGTGGTVGTAATALGQLNGPEVQLKGTRGYEGLTVLASGVTVRGLSIYGFTNDIGVGTDYTGTLIEQNVLGTSATSFTDPGANVRTTGQGISYYNADNGTLRNNLIGFNGGMGIWALGDVNGANNNTISGNEIRGNALEVSVSGEGLVFDGLELQGASTGNTVSGNLITANVGHGIDSYYNSVGGNTITGNTISNNGQGLVAGSGVEGSGLRVYGATNTTTISGNILSGNNGSGVLVENTAAKVVISQNAIFGNTRVGIDLLSNADANTTANTYNGNTGTTTNVTLNSSATTGGNTLLNYPVITSATVVGTSLLVKGYAKSSAAVELFIAQPSTSTAASPNNLFGQGATYLTTATEGTAADTDTRTGLSYSGTVNGIAQGTDTNANGFSFLIPLTAAQQAAVTAGVKLTATSTLSGATSEFSGVVSVNSAPVPNTLTNASLPSNYPVTTLSPNLSATANGGTASGATNSISYYTIASLPTSGTLTYNGTVLTSANLATTQLLPALLNTLKYTPDRGFVGNASFTYTATDANGATSATNNNGGTVSAGAATYVIPVIASADVTTTITGPGTLSAGQPSGTFTAAFTNNGPNDAATVTQTVALPSGATLTSAQQSAITTAYPGATFATSGGVTTITFPGTNPLASGASVVRQFAFTAPTATGAASISSTVGTATSQGVDTAPNSATMSLNVNAVADVVTTISANAASVAAGGTGQFNVTFSNNGPQDAAGVVGKVQLPLGLAGVTTSAGSYDATTGVITYAIGSLTTTAPQSLTVTYTQPANSSVTAASAVSTTSYEAGLTANNSASAVSSPVTTVDVATTISGPATTTVGAQVTYNVTTSNVSTATATSVVQTVTLPNGAANIYVTGGGVLNGSTVTFPAIGALAAGQSVNNTVSFTAPASASFNTVANVTATEDNSTSGNNTSTVATTTSAATAGAANLYTRISASATNVTAGTGLTFTVTQGNQGPNTAAGVVTRVALPTSLPITGTTALKIGGNAPTSTSGTVATYGSGAAAITYDSSTGLVTFATISSQASAATPASYTLTFNAPASGVVTATSTVTSTTPDVMMSNNVASTEVTVDPAATDVATALTGPDAATPGQRITYTVTTTNNGPAAATNVVQTVTIPAGLAITGATAVTIGGSTPNSTSGTVATYATGATYNSATGVVTLATIASQMAGATVRNAIAYLVPANGDASLVNTALVTSASTDYLPANNAASVVTTLQPSADVQVALTGPSTAVAGTLVSYGVTTINNGPSVAASVATTVQLPAGLSSVTVIGFDGTALTSAYNSSTGVVTFPAVSSQAPGGANASTGGISFAAPANVSLITPTAMTTVTGTTDPVWSNNAATVATTLTAPASTATNDLAVTLTRSAATATAGSAISFTIAATNNGTTTATGMIATLQLPAGLPTTGANALTVAGQAPSSTSGTVASYSFPGLAITYDSSTGLFVSTGLSINAGDVYSAVIGIPQAPGTGPVVATASVRGDQPDANLTNNVATQSIAITTVPDVATTISGPSVAPNGGPVAYTVTTSSNGPSPSSNVTQLVTLPAGITGYSLNGAAVVLGSTPTAGTTTITLPTPSTLAAGAASSVANTVSFLAPTGTTFNVVANVTGTNDAVAANNSATQTTTRFNAPPVATSVTNTLQSPEGNSATTAMLISPLAATSATSTIKQFNLSSLPPTTQGVLYYDNNGTLTALTPSNYAALNLSAAQANTLRFLPASGYVGNATFTYTATDNTNLVSNVATYLIPVGLDNSSVYTASTQVKGGSNKYVTGDVLAYVVDSNTAQYNGSGQLYNTATGALQSGAANGLATAVLASGSNALPTGVSLDPATGQLYVSNASQLTSYPTAQTYTVTITTVDSNGGVTTQPVSFTIGAYPLPVALVAFTAQAVLNRDALLTWNTASEKNNDHFEVERSFDGTSFSQLGQVAGHGTTSAASAYSLTDAGVAAKATGPVYYRLRQVDFDGTATYSPVRTVSFPKVASVALSLYPNPVVDRTTLDLSELPATGTYQVTLLDATGRTVRATTLGGSLAQVLDLHELATGTYHVLVTGQLADGSALTQRLRLIKE